MEDNVTTPVIATVNAKPDQGTQPEGTPDQTTNTPDYKALYETATKERAASTREYQALNEKLKSVEGKLGEITAADVTDEEIRASHPDWDSYTETEQRLARELEKNKKLSARTTDYVRSVVEQEENRKRLDKIYKDYPEIKRADFEHYMSQKSHQGIPVEALAKAFLFDSGINVTPPKTVEGTPANLEGDRTGKDGREPLPPKKTSPEAKKYLDSLKKNPMFQHAAASIDKVANL